MSILHLLASDGFLSVNKHIARVVGLDAAVLLAELASAYTYFESRDQLTPEGMFFETVERIQENTTLSQYQQSKAVKVLTDAGILKTKKIGIPARRYFLINEESVVNILEYKKSKNFITGDKKTSSQDIEKLDCNNNIDIKEKNNNKYIQETIEDFNNTCKSLPKVQKMTDGRRTAIRKAREIVPNLHDLFEKVERSDFLTGRTSAGFKASFDWILKRANLVKIIEGNYDNRSPAQSPPVPDEPMREEFYYDEKSGAWCI